jgi:hypothetical protein
MRHNPFVLPTRLNHRLAQGKCMPVSKASGSDAFPHQDPSLHPLHPTAYCSSIDHPNPKPIVASDLAFSRSLVLTWC